MMKNEIYEIEKEVNRFKEEGKRLFLTSSLQSHSIPLLHLIHNIDSDISVYFIDTGYHFPETIAFKQRLEREFGFNIQRLNSPVERIQQRDNDGRLMYASDPDYCCYMNKVLPIEPVLKEYDVWISGVRADQSSFRSELKKINQGKFGTLRYHPILNWDSQMVSLYQKEFNLPRHPLENQGYISIGCMPCTRKMELEGDPREMRWFGMNKIECGLQTETMEEK